MPKDNFSEWIEYVKNQENKSLDLLFQEISEKYCSYTPLEKQNIELLQKAFDFAKHIHRNQKRDSGVPYFTHPLIVAQILQEYPADSAMLAATLLHDAIEDSEDEGTAEQVKEIFGEDVYFLVDGVSKVGQIKGHDSHQDTLQKIFSHAAEDTRILVIKIADRVHNIATIGTKSGEEKRRKKIEETLEIYVFSAEKLQLDRFKTLLLDACYFYLFPERFSRVIDEIQGKIPLAHEIFQKISAEISGAHSEVSVEYRPYSISDVFQRGDAHIYDIHPTDLFYVDVVTDSKKDCYQALSWLSRKYNHKASLLVDFIANPPENGYTSLKTSMVVHSSYLVRFHILTKEMAQKNTIGIFSRFEKGENTLPFLSAEGEGESISNFIEILKNDVLLKKKCVHNPEKGQKYIPIHARSLDAVIHIFPEKFIFLSEVFCNGEKIDLGTKIIDNDILECRFAETVQADVSWMKFLSSSFGKIQLQKFLKTNEDSDKCEIGKNLLQSVFDQFREGEVTSILEKYPEILKSFSVQGYQELYIFVAEGMISTRDVLLKYESVQSQKLSFWGKIKRFFPRIFSQKEENTMRFALSSSALSATSLLQLLLKKAKKHHVFLHFIALKAPSSLVVSLSSEKKENIFSLFTLLKSYKNISEISFLSPRWFYIKMGAIFLIPLILASLLFFISAAWEWYSHFFYCSLVVSAAISSFGYFFISQYFSFARRNFSFLIGGLLLNVFTFALFITHIFLVPEVLYSSYSVYVLLALFAVSLFTYLSLFLKTLSVESSSENSSVNKSVLYAYLLGALSAISWGLNPVAIRVVLENSDIGPLFIASFRLLTGGVLLWIITFLFFPKEKNASSVFSFQEKTPLIIAFALTINFFLYQLGLRYTTATNANLIENFIPVIILLFIMASQAFKKEKKWILQHGLSSFAVVFIGSVGASILISDDPSSSLLNPSLQFLGDIIEVVAMIFFALYVYMNSYYLKKYPLKNALFLLRDILLFSGILSLPVTFFFEEIPSDFSLQSVLLLSFISVVATSLAYWAWNYASRHLNLISNSLLLNFTIIVTLITESILYKDELTLSFLIGFICILLASFLARKID